MHKLRWTGKSAGYNWRNTLSDFAAVSGVLAGFSVTFIALILAGSVADTEIFGSNITFGQLASLLFGFSAGLFVCSTEFFLHAKEFDIFSVPERYIDLLKDDCKMRNQVWTNFEDKQTNACRSHERKGRMSYNIAVFVVFFGLFFALAPYNLAISVIVAGFGITLELIQLTR